MTILLAKAEHVFEDENKVKVWQLQAQTRNREEMNAQGLQVESLSGCAAKKSGEKLSTLARHVRTGNKERQ